MPGNGSFGGGYKDKGLSVSHVESWQKLLAQEGFASGNGPGESGLFFSMSLGMAKPAKKKEQAFLV